jgi:Tfp pilus assembly protein PilF
MPSRNRPRNLVFTLLSVLAMGPAPAVVGAKPAAPAIGARVLIKGGAVLKVGDQVVDTGRAHRIYTIERVSGDWLWLISGAVSGWAQSEDVVPFDQAIDLFTGEIGRNPNAAWAFYNRGIVRQDQQNLDQAIADYTEAIRINPKYVQALINRGNAWQAKKDFDRAIADYTKAIQIDPKDILAYLDRGIAQQAKREFDKAIADYDEAIRLGMKTASVYNNRGHLWELKHDHEKAIADYSEAIRLSPRYTLAHFNRGNAWQSLANHEKAITDYSEAIRLDPTSPWGHAGLAWILATCPDPKYRDGKKAIEQATQACELGGSKDPYLAEVRAAAHAEAGDFEQAVEWQTKAVKEASGIPGLNTEGDRSRLKLYQEKKPYHNDRGVPTES